MLPLPAVGLAVGEGVVFDGGVNPETLWRDRRLCQGGGHLFDLGQGIGYDIAIYCRRFSMQHPEG